MEKLLPELTIAPPLISGLDDLTGKYTTIFCDIWGVVHNGLRAHSGSVEALTRAKSLGRTVILITNAPRRFDAVAEQLTALGVPVEAYDRIVTSGDVTRKLIAEGSRRIFHLGPERDLTLFSGLDVELCEEREASAVICTGFFDDETEVPEDYAEMLARFRSRNLPFVCANPDIVVERGDRLIWCAGALARDYAQLGGLTLIAGKPHRPIYEAALEAASDIAGHQIAHEEVLAIGDGMLTDVKGAEQNGFDVLYISGGIHARDYGDPAHPDRGELARFLVKHGSSPVGYMPKLI